MKAATRSFSPILPSSTRIITLVVVATTFVSDARSKIVSGVMGSGDGTTARWPIAFVIQRALTEADEHDRPRQFLVGDGLLDQRLNCVEP